MELSNKLPPVLLPLDWDSTGREDGLDKNLRRKVALP